MKMKSKHFNNQQQEGKRDIGEDANKSDQEVWIMYQHRNWVRGREREGEIFFEQVQRNALSIVMLLIADAGNNSGW